MNKALFEMEFILNAIVFKCDENFFAMKIIEPLVRFLTNNSQSVKSLLTH